ncbi:DUF2291 domain-containing protein [Niabella insulamsoli]|uniref:DUF2291 domain-containing protein n=1 Tax=Niabella insulamsoli TaxID=3144874 RepID=UPI0031FC16AA
MKKYIKYGLLLIAIALLGYNAVYIKKLSEVRASSGQKFDAATYVGKIWDEALQQKLDSAIEISALRQALQSDPEKAFSDFTKSLAIGNYRYALVKGLATVEQVNEDDISIVIESQPAFKAVFATEFIYGNALRDASGIVKLEEFPNTEDLNAISEALNQAVREKVVPAIKPLLVPGKRVAFVGAVELNKEHIRFDNIEIIPVSIKSVS